MNFVVFWNEEDEELTRTGGLQFYDGDEYHVEDFEDGSQHILTDDEVGKIKVLQNVEKFKPDDQEELF